MVGYLRVRGPRKNIEEFLKKGFMYKNYLKHEIKPAIVIVDGDDISVCRHIDAYGLLHLIDYPGMGVLGNINVTFDGDENALNVVCISITVGSIDDLAIDKLTYLADKYKVSAKINVYDREKYLERYLFADCDGKINEETKEYSKNTWAWCVARPM